MKLAVTYNLKTGNVEEDQEFDAPHHIEALVDTLRKLGHCVWVCEVTPPPWQWMPRLLRCAPDLVFNIAEGRGSRTREAVFPTLFEAYDQRYTGSDAWALTLTLDKDLTKAWLMNRDIGARLPWSRLLPVDEMPSGYRGSTYIVKPNYEGSSKGITDKGVGELRFLKNYAGRLLRKYPDGVLIESFVEGRDITVGWLETVGTLAPLTIVPKTRRATSTQKVYGYRQKGLLAEQVKHEVVDCPAAEEATKRIVELLGLRDFARLDFREDADGRVWFLEANALPSLEFDGAMVEGARGLSYAGVLAAIIESARLRYGL